MKKLMRRMNNMPVYHEYTQLGLVKWVDVEGYVDEFGKDLIFGDISETAISNDDIDLAYDLLCERYSYSTFRYTDPIPAMLAMRRISRFALPRLIQHQKLYKEIYEADIADLRKQRQSIVNTVEKPNDPVANADSVAINDLSNRQETTTLLSTQLEEIMNKWRMAERNFIEDFTNEYKSLFTVIITDSDDVLLYNQEEE